MSGASLTSHVHGGLGSVEIWAQEVWGVVLSHKPAGHTDAA